MNSIKSLKRIVRLNLSLTLLVLSESVGSTDLPGVIV